jgi:uroporphyrinogen III methyltransferase / synthase
MTVRPGTVYLVGAGPGDPGLLTVRGQELLRRADVVLHDRLVDPALLEEARSVALIIDVGKDNQGESERQREINTMLVRHARRGRVVVRLKGGDPLVFGRGWEEQEECSSAGVPCEIVPGVSSALAGPAAAGIPVTLRGVASSVAIAAAPVMGESQLDSLARADTAVILMGVAGLAEVARRLMGRGRSPSTPVAVVERATLPGQRVVRGTLETIAREAELSGCRAPAVIVVGATAALGTTLRGPLSGKRVVVTRPVTAAQELMHALSSLGAEVTVAPLIEIRPVEVEIEGLLGRVRSADWIVFTSRHGVRGLRQAIHAAGGDARVLAQARLAAVGPITGRELDAWGLSADLVPDAARADALAAALLAQSPRPTRVLLPGGTLALPTVADALGAVGIAVDRLLVYDTRPLALDARSREAIDAGVDAILLASPSAATALGESGAHIGMATIVCIGPTTAAAARAFSWTDVRVAADHSDMGILATTLAALAVREAA